MITLELPMTWIYSIFRSLAIIREAHAPINSSFIFDPTPPLKYQKNTCEVSSLIAPPTPQKEPPSIDVLSKWAKEKQKSFQKGFFLKTGDLIIEEKLDKYSNTLLAISQAEGTFPSKRELFWILQMCQHSKTIIILGKNLFSVQLSIQSIRDQPLQFKIDFEKDCKFVQTDNVKEQSMKRWETISRANLQRGQRPGPNQSFACTLSHVSILFCTAKRKNNITFKGSFHFQICTRHPWETWYAWVETMAA